MENLNYNALRQMGLIRLWRDFKSETCHEISEQEFHCKVSLSFYVLLFLTTDVAVLFEIVCLRVFCKWILIQPLTQAIHYLG